MQPTVDTSLFSSCLNYSWSSLSSCHGKVKKCQTASYRINTRTGFNCFSAVVFVLGKQLTQTSLTALFKRAASHLYLIS